jgi:hypothetical protein
VRKSVAVSGWRRNRLNTASCGVEVIRFFIAIRLPERRKPDSTTGFYPVGFDDHFLKAPRRIAWRPSRLAAINSPTAARGAPHPRAQNHFQIARDLVGKAGNAVRSSPQCGILQDFRDQFMQRAAVRHLSPSFGKAG